MIYLDGEGFVGSISICSDTERTGIVLSDQEHPNLEQLSETDSDSSNKTRTGKGKRYYMEERAGPNDGWK